MSKKQKELTCQKERFITKILAVCRRGLNLMWHEMPPHE